MYKCQNWHHLIWFDRTYNNGNHIMMTYATSSPAATTGAGQGNNNIPVSFPLFPFSFLLIRPIVWDIVVCCLYSTLNQRKNDGNVCWPWSCSSPACMSELCHFYNTTLAKGRARFRSVQCLRSLLETPRYAKANKPQDRCDQESPSGQDCQSGAEEEGKSIKRPLLWLPSTFCLPQP